jgi:Na+/proline symporter
MTVIAVTLSYMIGLFVIAYFVAKKYNQGRNLTDNAIVYALSLSIYCTAWTFYGNVGLAVTTSYLFIGVYIGPTLFFIFWRGIQKKIFEIKNKYAITSIAGFLSSRYGKSSAVGAIASLIALIGIVPYLSLQLKAIFTSYAFITTGSNIHVNQSHVDWIVLVSIIIFIITFGLRRLDQTEKHPGMVIVVVIQSVVKLVAFLTVGIFVTYFVYGGFGDIFSRVAANSELVSSLKSSAPSYSLFMAYTLLSMSAIMFLPRQFHMAVVENTNEKHTRMAVWLLPLYLFAITAFVFPIAMAGILQGHDAKLSDIFILLLPLVHGNMWISLLVFVGGLSAAISMILIVGITITSMTANYLVLPLFEKIRILGFLRQRLLFIRWMIVIMLMLIAYLFEVKIGSSYILVKIGMISFAAVLQFAPAAIGALYWKKGSKAGAIMGLLAGFAVWLYTSLFPALIKSGWLSGSILTDGPLGVRFLRPENLFGITNLDPLALTFLLSMTFNVGFFIAGSFLFGQSEKEKQIVSDYFDTEKKYDFLQSNRSQVQDFTDFPKKMSVINSIFSEYVGEKESQLLTDSCAEKIGLKGKSTVNLTELADLSGLVEKTLASYIGAPAASEAVNKAKIISEEETIRLADIYARMVAELKLTPKELGEKINLHVEKEKLLAKQQNELEKMVKERTKELQEKNEELERFQGLTVGRELKMMELKEKMKDLKRKANLS